MNPTHRFAPCVDPVEVIKMWLSFLGAAQTVTGSRFLIDHEGHRVLVDCGLFQGSRDLRQRNWAPLPVPPASLDAVVISHAHLDHTGWLPRLAGTGYHGPIYGTPHTLRLTELVLRDAAHLQEEDAEYATRKGFSKHRNPRPLYDSADAEKAISQLIPLEYHSPLPVADSLTATLRRAGHILGSASVEVRTATGSVLFSGDLGRPDHPLLLPPEPPSDVDTIVVESTYGDRNRGPDNLTRLADAMTHTLQHGGSVLIPAFAIDRTEVVLMALRSLMREGRVPTVPVWVDSPMAAAALEVYRTALAEVPAAELRPQPPGDPLGLASLRVARTVDESKLLNAPGEPSVIISASGMATGGRVVHHLAGLAPDPRNLIVLAGFQVPGTRGWDLLHGANAIKAHGTYVPVRAAVMGVDDFSCHADADQLMSWLKQAPREPRACYVVHGEPDSARTLADRLHRELGWCAVAARDGEKVAA
jgi:metallo-beta-lactamase family protein